MRISVVVCHKVLSTVQSVKAFIFRNAKQKPRISANKIKNIYNIKMQVEFQKSKIII